MVRLKEKKKGPTLATRRMKSPNFFSRLPMVHLLDRLIAYLQPQFHDWPRINHAPITVKQPNARQDTARVQ